MGGSICRCCNFTLLYAVLNIFSLFSSIVGDYCDPVLNQTPLQCQLRTYRTEEAIKCFDILSVNRSAPFHLLFVGDSRTRQQFFSFQKIIPKYDTHWNGFDRSGFVVHHDIDVESPILNVRISFRWRPTFTKSLIKELTEWPAADQKPSLIILGIAVHHMLPVEGSKVALFSKWLNETVPLLRKMPPNIRVIWLSQNPILSVFPKELADESAYITLPYIDRYNQIARQVFQNTEVVIWDTSAPISWEYIRGCEMIDRKQDERYHYCPDFIHLGYVAIDHTTQILLNYLCNKRMDDINPQSDICCA